MRAPPRTTRGARRPRSSPRRAGCRARLRSPRCKRENPPSTSRPPVAPSAARPINAALVRGGPSASHPANNHKLRATPLSDSPTRSTLKPKVVSKIVGSPLTAALYPLVLVASAGAVPRPIARAPRASLSRDRLAYRHLERTLPGEPREPHRGARQARGRALQVPRRRRGEVRRAPPRRGQAPSASTDRDAPRSRRAFFWRSRRSPGSACAGTRRAHRSWAGSAWSAASSA